MRWLPVAMRRVATDDRLPPPPTAWGTPPSHGGECYAERMKIISPRSDRGSPPIPSASDHTLWGLTPPQGTKPAADPPLPTNRATGRTLREHDSLAGNRATFTRIEFIAIHATPVCDGGLLRAMVVFPGRRNFRGLWRSSGPPHTGKTRAGETPPRGTKHTRWKVWANAGDVHTNIEFSPSAPVRRLRSSFFTTTTIGPRGNPSPS